MLNLEQLIGDLLVRHNCVVIPAFGGFVAQQQSAKIDLVNGWMFPPKKSILFNKQLSNNDGLLIDAFSKATKCSFDEATVSVKSLVQSWNISLSKGERIAIDRVGFIYLDNEKNVCFEQDRFFNLLLSSYGLGKVHFVSEKEERVVEQKIIVAEEVISITPKETIHLFKEATETTQIEEQNRVIQLIPAEKEVTKTSTKLWKYIAAACLLPVAFYTIWIPVKTDVLESGIISFKDFNPMNKEVPSVYSEKELNIKKISSPEFKSLDKQLEKVETNSSTYQYNFSDDVFVTVRLDKKSNLESPAVETASVHAIEVNKPIIAEAKKSGLNYIVGCFGSEANAKNLVSTLKSQGLNGSVVDIKNGLYRVSAGTAETQDQIAKIISVAESKGYQGWVMK